MVSGAVEPSGAGPDSEDGMNWEERKQSWRRPDGDTAATYVVDRSVEWVVYTRSRQGPSDNAPEAEVQVLSRGGHGL